MVIVVALGNPGLLIVYLSQPHLLDSCLTLYTRYSNNTLEEEGTESREAKRGEPEKNSSDL